MDVDSPSNQPVTTGSNETDTEIREKKRQEFQQARKELRELVEDLPDGLDGLAGDITHFEEELGCDVYAIEKEHQSSEERYKDALGEFKRRWNDAKKNFEQPFYFYCQQAAQDAVVELLYSPVEAFMTEFQTLQQASEVEINHPEVSFKKDLNSLRERLEERKWTALCLKEKLGETVEKLENACKRVDELEKLAKQ
ncbi:hypothetical protein T069G_00747 [Trichoderma breve]|uniref:Uncharacterized protein n=1 Tax=Trichoderma breve TaxID=2034170 RepID=A0A9W9ECR6_9HYPO|nr:hypothetical protein T069G_00747 [Trichoderma breve]KAJ4864217.1 hypothetical protein T069G_00747 [Trichoderma breve]